MRKVGITEYVILKRYIYRYEVQCERNRRTNGRYQGCSKYFVLVRNTKENNLLDKAFPLCGNVGIEKLEEKCVINVESQEENIDNVLSEQAEEVIKKNQIFLKVQFMHQLGYRLFLIEYCGSRDRQRYVVNNQSINLILWLFINGVKHLKWNKVVQTKHEGIWKLN